MTLRLMRDGGQDDLDAAVHPLQLFQETVRLAREQLDAAFDDLSARERSYQGALNDVFIQTRNTLLVLENNVVILGFRTGHVEFSRLPEAPPT